MDTTLLRTLTLKSTMKFGKFYDLTVRNIIESIGKKGVNYLVWVYYNSNQIDFMPDVLDMLHILPEYRIKKPGKIEVSENIYYQSHQKQASLDAFMELSDEEKSKSSGMERKRFMRRAKTDKRNTKINDNTRNSKILNRNYGQGKGAINKLASTEKK